MVEHGYDENLAARSASGDAAKFVVKRGTKPARKLCSALVHGRIVLPALRTCAQRTLPQLAEEILNDSTDSESKILGNGLDQEEFEKRIKIK